MKKYKLTLRKQRKQMGIGSVTESEESKEGADGGEEFDIDDDEEQANSDAETTVSEGVPEDAAPRLTEEVSGTFEEVDEEVERLHSVFKPPQGV